MTLTKPMILFKTEVHITVRVSQFEFFEDKRMSYGMFAEVLI